MGRFSHRWTGIKLFFVYILTVAEIPPIVWFFWPEAIKSATLGGGDYGPGPISTTFLAALILGIPGLLVVTLSYVFLTYALFREGEIEDFKARNLLDRVKTPTREQPASKQSPTKNFES